MAASDSVTAESREDREMEAAARELFVALDTDGSGAVSAAELRAGLHRLRLPCSQVQVQQLLRTTDTDGNGELDWEEFRAYALRKQRELAKVFDEMDENGDGRLDRQEVAACCARLSLDVDAAEVDSLLQRVDRDGTMTLSLQEWRDFLMLLPSSDVRDIFRFWRKSVHLDIGEQMPVPDMTKEEKKSGMWLTYFVSGGLAGAVSRTSTAPLDRLKILLQVQGPGGGAGSQPAPRLGLASGLRFMINEGGVWSLWRGNGLNVMKIAPESALKFAAYERVKELMGVQEGTVLRPIDRMLAGAVAGMVSQFAIYPLELLKTRLAAAPSGTYGSLPHAVTSIARENGWRFFYRGLTPSLIGIIPYSGIDLACYETLKNAYAARNVDQEPGTLVLLGCGAVSCTVAQLVSYPLALARTRMQAQGLHADGEKYRNLADVFRKTVARQGVAGLYSGLTANFLKVIPSVSISYAVYERTKGHLNNR